MRNDSTVRGSKAARIPFAGLGFDLGPVLARAAGMRLVPLPHAPSVVHAAPAAFRPAGYELQVRLGREIRAG